MEKNIPRRRFKEFVGSGEWEEKKFGDIFPTIKSGNRLPKDLLKEGNIPYVIATVENNGVFMKIDKNTLDYHGNNMKLFEAPSITFSIDNPDAIFLQEQAFFTSNIMRVLNNEDLSKNEYIFFLELLRKLTGGFDWSIKFSGPVVLNLDIRIPYDRERKNINYKEIQKIGDFFQKLDRLIDINRQKLGKLKASKSAYLAEMFPREGEDRPRRRFQGFTGEWEEKKIRDIFRITRGNVLATTMTSKQKSDYYCYPVYSSQTLNNGLMGYYNDYLYEDSITWTTDGANAGTVKYRSGKFYCTNVCGVLLSNEGYSNKMVAEVLNKVAWQYVSKVGNPKLMNNIMGEIIINIPSLAEQEKIGNFFQKLDDQIGLQEEKIEKLEKMKKAYLAEMFV